MKYFRVELAKKQLIFYQNLNMKTNLSVNLNKVALIRNARGEHLPNLYQIARDIEKFGAEGITVHPRPDERHIRYSDIAPLKKLVTTELNVEGNPTPRFMDLVIKHQPHQCTLVPDKPAALTSTEGWDTVKFEKELSEIVSILQANQIRVSIFVNPDERFIEGAKAVGADRIELYTGVFAKQFDTENRAAEMAKHTACGQLAHDLGLGVNAGHDLNLNNLRFYKQNMPYLDEVSIGHALVSDALYFGFEKTIAMYLKELKD